MSYILRYGAPIKQEQRTGLRGRWRYAVCASVLAAAIFVICFFPEAAEAVRSVLIPGDDAVTVAAFRQFLGRMETDAPISECITVFCEEVLHGVR